MAQRPGAQLARRPLHFFLLLDCSGSMASAGKMRALNTAIREMLPHLSDTAANQPHAQVLVRVIRFGTRAAWHLAEPTDPDDIVWSDLQADGYTDLGAALDLLGTVLTVPPMQERALAPAIVLVSDGMPTDDYEDALARLTALPWGARSVRMAVAIGHEAAYEPLRKFIGDTTEAPLSAASPEQLMLALRWASVHVARASSVLAPEPPPPRELMASPGPALFTPGDDSEVIW